MSVQAGLPPDVEVTGFTVHAEGQPEVRVYRAGRGDWSIEPRGARTPLSVEGGLDRAVEVARAVAHANGQLHRAESAAEEAYENTVRAAGAK